MAEPFKLTAGPLRASLTVPSPATQPPPKGAAFSITEPQPPSATAPSPPIPPAVSAADFSRASQPSFSARSLPAILLSRMYGVLVPPPGITLFARPAIAQSGSAAIRLAVFLFGWLRALG